MDDFGLLRKHFPQVGEKLLMIVYLFLDVFAKVDAMR